MAKLQNVRDHFPLLSDDPRLAFLDSGATAQKPQTVLEAMWYFQREANASPNRGAYYLARLATERYEEARAVIARFIGARDPRSLVITTGTTTSINTVARSWARWNLTHDRGVLFTEMEHHADIVPWQQLQISDGIPFGHVRMRDNGTLNLGDLEKKLQTGRYGLVCVVHVSNVLSTRNPIEKIVALAKSYGATVLIDMAQSVPHMPVDCDRLGADFVAFSGHKMLGPTGVGGLYVHPRRFSEMHPYVAGGDMITRVYLDRSEFQEMPRLLEAGTQNVAGVVGLAAACRYLSRLGMENVEEHVRELGEYAWKRLSEIPGVRLYGPGPGPNSSMSLVSFTVDGHANDEIAEALDEASIAVRHGSFCAHPLLDRLGITGAIRASFQVYNTKDEVDRLVKVVRDVAARQKAENRPAANSGCACSG